jgi:uncharacterized protein
MAAMTDLTDAELDELDALLTETPPPYRPLDAVRLDGYLCGVLVQPRPIGPNEWLAPVFDIDGAAFPASADPRWRARCEALIARHHAARRRALAESADFEPLLAASADASGALQSWVEGFEHALRCFPGLACSADEGVQAALARMRASAGAEASLDEAIGEKLDALHELSELTHDARWRVPTVRRESPKPGRNDRCPCGSGRKFKQCHGAR